ncbi:hypothetical protein L7F22_060196 [Adiantum nelumboides]|nr:hypothetical protein [Adiantum nelumboides]
MHRDAEKLYGRKFLLKHHPDQYRVLLSNYGEMGKWFAKVDSIGDLRNNLERKNHVLSIIRDKIGNLKDIVIDGSFYPWKEEDIYSWCIKSLASKRKYSKKKIDQSMPSSSGSMPINQDLDDEGVEDLHEKVTDLHQDAPLDKTIENAQDDNDLMKLDDMGAIMVHEKEKEEEKSAHEDVEVYIPEIPWENNNEQNDAYEEMKDDTSSELCDVNIDLSSRKSARKRKATSKLLELLKKKEKVLRVSKNKNKKELPRESRESTIQSSYLETKTQEPTTAIASTSDSATMNTLTALQEELQQEKLQRQLLVSGFMTQTEVHEAKVKDLEQELEKAKAELEIHKQQNEALNLPGTSHHDEEKQGPTPRALDVRGDIEQNIEDMPEEPAKDFLLHEKRVMESMALAYL